MALFIFKLPYYHKNNTNNLILKLFIGILLQFNTAIEIYHKKAIENCF